MSSVISTIVVLGTLIFVHELGHFLVAKLCGVRVLIFSLGFGPKVFGFKKGETEYLLSAVPLGGYVKMLGEGKESEDQDVSAADEPFSYAAKTPLQRLAIVFAGPFTNILFAAMIFSLVYLYGVPSLNTRIGEVNPDFPAFTAGIQAGDKVLAVNGQPVDSWDALSNRIKKSQGMTISLTVERDSVVETFEVPPKKIESENVFGELVVTYVVGITAAGETDILRYPPGQALVQGVVETWNIIKLTIVGFIKLIERVIPAKTLGGPILIAQMAGQQAKAGLLNLIYFMGIISVNLGILNLFPIPILDGGHIVFILIEIIVGKPVSMRKMEIAQQVGMFILISLMIYVFYNDLARIFTE
ncbi:MAG: RIP metalloprotease RseP [Deltaproteobacteria bacterium]|nr:RIP metalloprotease RseP [Candidatus Anaeroferrophillus wilburensis]MBN2889329.1 RIP metalloprotease RseP [Deltaproteobacteria bacterium]